MIKIIGSVRFTLLTVRLKKGTVTVALAVKKGTVKKSENSTDQSAPVSIDRHKTQIGTGPTQDRHKIARDEFL